MLTLEINICQTQIEKEEKKYMKNYNYKIKNLLNLNNHEMFVLLGNIENLGGQHHNLKLKDIKIGMF